MQMAMREEKVFNCLVSCSFSWQNILNLPILTGLGKSRVFFDHKKNPKGFIVFFFAFKGFSI